MFSKFCLLLKFSLFVARCLPISSLRLSSVILKKKSAGFIVYAVFKVRSLASFHQPSNRTPFHALGSRMNPFFF